MTPGIVRRTTQRVRRRHHALTRNHSSLPRRLVTHHGERFAEVLRATYARHRKEGDRWAFASTFIASGLRASQQGRAKPRKKKKNRRARNALLEATVVFLSLCCSRRLMKTRKEKDLACTSSLSSQHTAARQRERESRLGIVISSRQCRRPLPFLCVCERERGEREE